MTAALVTLTGPDVKWSAVEEAAFVGKDILELLTSSMYVDPMSLFREYVQNSADAVDVARSAGVLAGDGHVEIRLDQNKRSLKIRDNGAGLASRDFVRQLTALGGSKKRNGGFRGFRGVGRLAGLSFCQELIFRSRNSGEDPVREIRWDSREVRSLLRSADNSQDLREIISRVVRTRVLPDRNWPNRFFEVELNGVVRYRDDRLLNQEAISAYLSQVAPVNFHPDFGFGPEIQRFLQTHAILSGALKIEVVGQGLVYRPHRDWIPFGKSGGTQFRELKTAICPGRDGNPAAATWVLHHDYKGALPTASLVGGWRLRSGDIQVGESTLLESLFPESRFNSWCVAETHVVDPKIVPNGRRDHFEQNTHYFDLLNHLAPVARDVAHRCRASSIARNLFRAIEFQMGECVEDIRTLRKGPLTDASRSKVLRHIQATLKELDRLLGRMRLSPEQKSQYESKVARLRQSLDRVGTAICSDEAIFRGFSRPERSILSQIFNTIYQIKPNLYEARELVETILSRLSRERRTSRRLTKKRRK